VGQIRQDGGSSLQIERFPVYNIFRVVRRNTSSKYSINSWLGSIFLNIAQVCVIGIILSINLNIIVKATNGSRMPVVAETFGEYEINTDRHVLATSETNLKILADWIVVKKETFIFLRETPIIWFATMLGVPIGERAIVSPGDIGMWLFASTGTLSLMLAIFCSLLTFVQQKLKFI